MATLERAIRIAVEAHTGQRDKEGQPYILHPLRVMMSVTSEHARIAAILHDVVEDTSVTIDDLRREGFADAVLHSVELLTHAKSVPYADYVVRVKTDPVATAVKLADLTDNTRLDRTLIREKTLTKDQKRWVRYAASAKFLLGELDELTYRRLLADAG
jgi:(p)ppGpp synthase/HD superfamily hydrolase